VFEKGRGNGEKREHKKKERARGGKNLKREMRVWGQRGEKKWRKEKRRKRVEGREIGKKGKKERIPTTFWTNRT